MLCAQSLLAQRFSDQIPSIKRYFEKDIIDSLQGINMYKRLVAATGGDSIKYNGQGYNLQGWSEDFYMSGKLLHRGYYLNGQLITYKNFFENGQCERVLMNPDPLHCNETIYFNNGNTRRETNYYNGLPQKRSDYFENGQQKYSEEYEKQMRYLIRSKTWYASGGVETSLELSDPKTLEFDKKTYYNNGQIKEQGSLLFSESTKEYVKIGAWTSYDVDGKNKQVQKHPKTP